MHIKEKFRCLTLKTFLAGLNLLMILGVMVAAFIVSFHTQTIIAQAAGVPESLSPLIPICVDLTLVALAGNALYARIVGRCLVLPVFLIVLSSIISVFLNVYLAPNSLTGSFDAFLPSIIPEVSVSILIHSIPPFFLLLLTEVALSFISPEQPQQGGEISSESTENPLSIPDQPKKKSRTKRRTAVATETRTQEAKKRRERVARKKAENPGITKRQLAREEGVTPRTIQSDLREIKKNGSHEPTTQKQNGSENDSVKLTN